jgi:hypothetical protein
VQVELHARAATLSLNAARKELAPALSVSYCAPGD